MKNKFPAVQLSVPFRAARALMAKEQAEVAKAAGLTVAVIQNLERGKMSRPSYEQLRSWYEANNVEFTGWGDVATGKYYGVGVRWKDSKVREVTNELSDHR
ncbi:helix-turn-helix domain-containing protein [Rhizobium subbaraonis]|uniref:helix-turn-helix domain-containing protein n=1 Tax=Rhizobium subbaraonis TaxID=908946 RepID=UPI001FE11F57|nr:helix-turn-helix domain-containing protein [Rhizobium subbaraonis]